MNHTKFLGITIDSKLSFKEHVNVICKKLSKSVGVLYKLNSFLPNNILKTLYNSLILPYISYGVESWYGAPQFVADRVRVLQKKAVRAVYCLPYNSHTEQYFLEGKILKLCDLHRLSLLSLVYIYLDTEGLMADRFNARSEIHDHVTRNRNMLTIPQYRKSTTQSCFLFRSIKVWNAFPTDLLQCSSKKVLKSHLKKYFCSCYGNDGS